ncbi:type VI secretion system protein TssA [Rhizobium oryzicola]|uniref:Type VI secretion system protein TssA n=1 Tax=Rhizobium oryzicola TaxID=1232668 RepID=A0ABT8SY10_9HYPH|nr:type VI secretion system protein TssA [Rhizobium oryzicola]MDO1583084.1 type VI secretion system protein TssA [Rhizobium oryzicola]
MNIETLADPISSIQPCGENIRINTSYKDVYFKIKDARGMARASERAVTPGENIGTSPLWQEVNNLGLQIFASFGKDIEVLAWLTEAQLRLEGYRGLRNMYRVTVSLLEQYFEELHSIGEEDDEERFAPLAGLNGVGSEGTLIQAIRLTSLVPGAKYGQHTLWDFQVSQRPGEERKREALENAIADANVAHIAEHLNVLMECISLFDRITEILSERCGDSAPPSSNTRNVLHEALTALRFLSKIPENEAISASSAQAAAPSSENADAPDSGSNGAIAMTRRQAAEQISSREEAFDILQAVARYFRKAEPHSPMSMSIETLVRRGRMDFSELLTELLPDAHQRQAVLTAAGIRSGADTS